MPPVINNMLKLSIVVFSVIVVSLCLCPQIQAYFVKAVCEYSKDYIRNVTCLLKPISRHVKSFTISFDVYRPIPDMMVNTGQLKKTSSNRYMPGLYNISKNLCNTMRTGSVENQFTRMFLKNTFPGREDGVLKIFRDCPYKGEVFYESVFDDAKFQRPPMLSLGEYKNVLTVYNEKTSFVYFKLEMYQELLRDVKG